MASGQIGHFPKFKSVADVSSDLLGLFELIYIYLTSNLVQPILAYVCHTSLVFFTVFHYVRFNKRGEVILVIMEWAEVGSESLYNIFKTAALKLKYFLL